MIRLLIIDDDAIRAEKLRSWLPAETKPVVARSAGAAIGTLRLDRGLVYAGIVLDYHLEGESSERADLTGQDVVQAIITYVPKQIPVFIHSRSSTGRAAMSDRLRRAGFDVTVLPVDLLTREQFCEWLEAARENWAELTGPT